MNAEKIASDARTVVHLAHYFNDLKRAALALVDEIPGQQRGYYQPAEEEQMRAHLVSYWKSRGALLELIHSIRREVEYSGDRPPRAFLVAMGAALILVDAARFLRDNFNDNQILRKKWNQPAPEFGIPGGTFDAVQKSLVSAQHAWHLFHAHAYYEQHKSTLRLLAQDDPDMAAVIEVIDRLLHRIDVSVAQFAKVKLRVRSEQLMRGLGRNLLLRALYGLQKVGASMMADVYVRPGHEPKIPESISQQLHQMLTPGDVLVVRKEYALTNYFLPGHWPHAALYLGDRQSLVKLAANWQAAIVPRWIEMLRENATSSEANAGSQKHVLESMKDGVQVRPLISPLSSDSLVVLRPRIAPELVSKALLRGLVHEGKPYDFDFDFRRSDRLVCTEVIYRAYEGIGDISFPLEHRAGRLTLSGGDLIQMAVKREHFDPIVVFAPWQSNGLLSGNDADHVLRSPLSQ